MYEVLFEIEQLKNEDLENELSKIKKQTKDYKLIKKENKLLKLYIKEALKHIKDNIMDIEWIDEHYETTDIDYEVNYSDIKKLNDILEGKI